MTEAMTSNTMWGASPRWGKYRFESEKATNYSTQTQYSAELDPMLRVLRYVIRRYPSYASLLRCSLGRQHTPDGYPPRRNAEAQDISGRVSAMTDKLTRAHLKAVSQYHLRTTSEK